MTRLSIPGQVDISYTFPSATTNNGKITSQTDNISGETVTYLYDSLNRLSAANGSGWNQNFGYDGFGNLVSKTGTNSPVLSVAVDPATNRVVGQSYDANGNQQTTPTMSGYLGYDVENRLLTTPGLQYAYDAQNKRIWKGMFDGNGYLTGQELYFYGVDGQKLGTYTLRSDYGQNRQTVLWDDTPTLAVFFGGKRVAVGGAAFVPDRLGSKGKYYPYGEERNSPPLTNDQVKFATYTRDSATGLDYADQRYYASTFGRFMTPDPYKANNGGAGDASDPGSWNRYAYTRGDPANRYDPRGLRDGEEKTTSYCDIYVEDWICSPYPVGNGGGGGQGGGQMAADPRLLVSYAVGHAEDRLFNKDCAGLFLDPSSNTLEARKALSDKLDQLFQVTDPNSTIRIQQGRNPDSPNAAAFTTDTLGLIYIYSDGPFFTGKLANGQSVGSTSTFSGMQSWDFQALVIIHEFLHWMGIVGPDSGNFKDVQWTLPNGDKVTGSDGLSREVRKKCF